jgi:hypothetical protein
VQRFFLMTSTYVHIIEGRLRIKIAGLKGDSIQTSKVENALRSVKALLTLK